MEKERKKIAAVSALFVAVALLLVFVYLLRLEIGAERPIPILAVAVFGIMFIYLVSHLMIYVGERNGVGKEAEAAAHLFAVFGYAVLAIVLLYMLNVNITGLLVGAGFLGIVVGLAAQTTLGNLFAGIFLLAVKPFKRGDKIRLYSMQFSMIAPSYTHGRLYSGVAGRLERIGLLYTYLTNDEGIVMMIPNNTVAQSFILNRTRTGREKVRVRFELDINIDYPKFEGAIRASVKNDKALRGKTTSLDVYIGELERGKYSVFVQCGVPPNNETAVKQRIKEIGIHLLAGGRSNK